jgi:hypothetical protein
MIVPIYQIMVEFEAQVYLWMLRCGEHCNFDSQIFGCGKVCSSNSIIFSNFRSDSHSQFCVWKCIPYLSSHWNFLTKIFVYIRKLVEYILFFRLGAVLHIINFSLVFSVCLWWLVWKREWEWMSERVSERRPCTSFAWSCYLPNS